MTEKLPPSAEPVPGAVPLAKSQDSTRDDIEWRFGDISLFCAWSPGAERVARASTESKQGAADATSKEGTSSVTAIQPASAKVNAEAEQSTMTPFMVVADEVPLTLWHARRISAVATSEQNPGMFALADLRAVVPQLISDAREELAPAGVPLYFVLHIGAIDKPSKQRVWRAQEEGGTGGLAGRPILNGEIVKQLLDMLDEIRVETGLTLVTEKAPGGDSEALTLDAAYYEHYSAPRRARGYLVLDPRFSLVIDCAEEDVRILLSIVQQAPVTSYGLAAAGYTAVLMRVSLWDSNSDMQASLDDLAQVNRSGAASALGQILLSFALAGIGTVLSLTPLPGARPGQLVAPMLTYALAAIAHSFYALTGKRAFYWSGVLCLLLATVLAIVIFVDPAFVVPFLPNKP